MLRLAPAQLIAPQRGSARAVARLPRCGPPPSAVSCALTVYGRPSFESQPVERTKLPRWGHLAALPGAARRTPKLNRRASVSRAPPAICAAAEALPALPQDSADRAAKVRQRHFRLQAPPCRFVASTDTSYVYMIAGYAVSSARIRIRGSLAHPHGAFLVALLVAARTSRQAGGASLQLLRPASARTGRHSPSICRAAPRRAVQVGSGHRLSDWAVHLSSAGNAGPVHGRRNSSVYCTAGPHGGAQREGGSAEATHAFARYSSARVNQSGVYVPEVGNNSRRVCFRFSC